MAKKLETKLSYRYQCYECGKDEIYDKMAKLGEIYSCEECWHEMYFENTIDLTRDGNTGGRGIRRR
jgi:ribosomal protein L37AE/L43A